MLRETQFVLGGVVLMTAGVAFAAALAWGGAGLPELGAWIGSGLAVAFGAFFVTVGRDERRMRRKFLEVGVPKVSRRDSR
jgi:hypothetical protein